jgi:hypothetical protein
MTTDRRQFLDKLALGAVAVGGAAIGLSALPRELSASPTYRASEFDVRWPSRLTGRVRAVFDVPEVESAYGVWRATLWARQFEGELGIPAAQLSTALVLRHNAIVLAMQQSFWDKYGLGEVSKATHPLTGEPTKRNPALLSAADGTPAPYDSFALQPFMSRGGVILACNLALADMVALVAKTDGVSDAVARERAVAGLVPGVILQASGVFAVLLAQHEKQTMYIRAS